MHHDLGMDVFEAVVAEPELVVAQHRAVLDHDVRGPAGIVLEARQRQLLGDAVAAHHRPPFQHQAAEARLRTGRRRRSGCCGRRRRRRRRNDQASGLISRAALSGNHRGSVRRLPAMQIGFAQMRLFGTLALLCPHASHVRALVLPKWKSGSARAHGTWVPVGDKRNGSARSHHALPISVLSPAACVRQNVPIPTPMTFGR